MWNDIKTYNLKRPMDWETFRKMPGDLQKEYILWLESEFDFRASGARELFGVSDFVYGEYRRLIGTPGPSKRPWDKSKKEKFRKWIKESHKYVPETSQEENKEIDGDIKLYLKAINLNLTKISERLKIQNQLMRKIVNRLEEEDK